MRPTPLLALLSVLLFVLLSGCTSNTRYARLIVESDLSPNYQVSLVTSIPEQADVYVEVARLPAGADGRVIFSRLQPGEYRMTIYNTANEGVLTTEQFGIGTNGDSTYVLDANLPP